MQSWTHHAVLIAIAAAGAAFAGSTAIGDSAAVATGPAAVRSESGSVPPLWAARLSPTGTLAELSPAAATAAGPEDAAVSRRRRRNGSSVTIGSGGSGRSSMAVGASSDAGGNGTSTCVIVEPGSGDDHDGSH